MTSEPTVSDCPVEDLDDEQSPADTAAADALYHWVFLAIAVGIIALAFVLRVRGEDQVVVPLLNQPLPATCTLKRFSGLDCPGCGLTRSLISLAHGDMARAWHFNPAGLAVALVVVVQIPYRLAQLHRLRRGLPQWRCRGVTNGVILSLAVVLFLQWVARLV